MLARGFFLYKLMVGIFLFSIMVMMAVKMFDVLSILRESFLDRIHMMRVLASNLESGDEAFEGESCNTSSDIEIEIHRKKFDLPGMLQSRKLMMIKKVCVTKMRKDKKQYLMMAMVNY